MPDEVRWTTKKECTGFPDPFQHGLPGVLQLLNWFLEFFMKAFSPYIVVESVSAVGMRTGASILLPF